MPIVDAASAGGVVHAISHHGHAAVPRNQVFDDAHLVCGKQAGVDLRDPRLPSDRFRGFARVPGEERDVVDSEPPKRVSRLARGRTNRVPKSNQSQDPFVADDNDGLSLGFERALPATGICGHRREERGLAD